jgi:hypothetical protein
MKWCCASRLPSAANADGVDRPNGTAEAVSYPRAAGVLGRAPLSRHRRIPLIARNAMSGATGPQGLKPTLISRAYAALKGRSSTVPRAFFTVIHAFLSFSAACEAVPFPRAAGVLGRATLSRHRRIPLIAKNAMSRATGPQGLKPTLISRAYAGLKGRSSTVPRAFFTVIHAFLSFSAACEAVAFPRATGVWGRATLCHHRRIPLIAKNAMSGATGPQGLKPMLISRLTRP